MVSRTAMFVDPYLPDAQHGDQFRGEAKIPQEKLTAAVTRLDRLGISVKMHCAGDGAVREAVNAIEAARKANGRSGPIHTVAHGAFVTDSDLRRLRPLNIAIDASPTVWYPGPVLDGTVAVIGKERAYRFFPFQAMVKAGILVAGGTDWKSLPDEFSDLWSGIEGLVTRRNPTGSAEGALAADQAVDMQTALRFYTLNSAKAMRLDTTTGSIEVGKSADLAVLDQNLFEIPHNRIAHTKVVATIFEGKTVYKQP